MEGWEDIFVYIFYIFFIETALCVIPILILINTRYIFFMQFSVVLLIKLPPLSSFLLMFTALLTSGEVFQFVAFCQRYPHVLIHILTFSLASAIGQV